MQKLWIIFLFIGTVSCHSDKKPEGVLTQPQLSALLVEIYLAEARVDQVQVTKDSSIRFFLPFEEKLLKSKGVTDAALRETYTYYLSHPKELEQVYEAVIDTLAFREQRIGKKLHVPVKETRK